MKLINRIPNQSKLKKLESSPYLEVRAEYNKKNDRVQTFDVSFGIQMTKQMKQIEEKDIVYRETEPPKKFVRRINFSQQAERARIHPYIINN